MCVCACVCSRQVDVDANVMPGSYKKSILKRGGRGKISGPCVESADGAELKCRCYVLIFIVVTSRIMSLHYTLLILNAVISCAMC